MELIVLCHVIMKREIILKYLGIRVTAPYIIIFFFLFSFTWEHPTTVVFLLFLELKV